MDLENNIIKFFAGGEVTYISSNIEASAFVNVTIRDTEI